MELRYAIYRSPVTIKAARQRSLKYGGTIAQAAREIANVVHRLEYLDESGVWQEVPTVTIIRNREYQIIKLDEDKTHE